LSQEIGGVQIKEWLESFGEDLSDQYTEPLADAMEAAVHRAVEFLSKVKP